MTSNHYIICLCGGQCKALQGWMRGRQSKGIFTVCISKSGWMLGDHPKNEFKSWWQMQRQSFSLLSVGTAYSSHSFLFTLKLSFVRRQLDWSRHRKWWGQRVVERFLRQMYICQAHLGRKVRNVSQVEHRRRLIIWLLQHKESCAKLNRWTSPSTHWCYHTRSALTRVIL